MRSTKIVCTLGPASSQPDRIMQLIEAGMDAARINFSHGSQQDYRSLAALVRRAARHAGKPVAIIGDLSGPKLRVGHIENGEVTLDDGEQVRLRYGEFAGTAEVLPHSYEPLCDDVAVGDPVMINDGLFRLEVTGRDGADVICEVVNGGKVSDHKGLNLPRTALSISALTKADRRNIELARELELDYLALSFVRKAEDIHLTKKLAGDIPIIAKIEKPEAIENLDEIVAATDAVMVARGDLGVELGQEKVPLLQKRIIRAARLWARPVITATQMLESMINNPVPTRAETSDVANAVLDGTDAVMLSGETAVGRYPLQTVMAMRRIVEEIEQHRPDWPLPTENVDSMDKSFSSAIAEAVLGAQREMKLKAIAVYTMSGRTARLISAERPDAGVLAFAGSEAAARRLAINWGVVPLQKTFVQDVKTIVMQVQAEMLQRRLATPGDDIAITFGLVLEDEPFQTNVLKLWKLKG